jgi:outer membrane protein assembly factor BamB
MKHFICTLCVFSLFSFVALAQEPNWNQFRGPNSDNHSSSTGIAKSWPEGGPKLLWKIDGIGRGYSTVSFYGDKMFTMGDIDEQCYVFCLDRATGKEIWKSRIGRGGDGGGRYPGTLATPACDGETVYAMSQFSDFVALDVKDGAVRWRKNTQDDLGGSKMAGWGYAMSPITDGDKILLQIGGDAGNVAAFDKTGRMLWRTEELKFPASYASVVPVEIGGVKQYMILTGNLPGPGRRDPGPPGVIAGISPTDGKVLWKADFPGQTAVCSDPVFANGVVMASCHYGVGAYFYNVTKEGNNFKVENFKGGIQELASHHGGIVAVGNHFYLLTNNQMVCIEAKTGNIVWQDRSVGKGSITYVDGKLILRSEGDDGTIAMIEATPEGYKELGRFDQPYRSERRSWPYPVVVDGKLYIRDQNVLLCYDLK